MVTYRGMRVSRLRCFLWTVGDIMDDIEDFVEEHLGCFLFLAIIIVVSLIFFSEALKQKREQNLQPEATISMVMESPR